MPVDPNLYGLYLAVMAVLAVTPGPANLFAVATGLAAGPGAALRGVLGMNCATLVWFAAAALGLGGLAAAFPAVFRAVAVLGGLYVAWLGFSALQAAWRGAGGVGPPPPGAAPRRAFRDGFAVQIANPKAVLFFTAVLPPFLDPARPLGAQLALFAAATITLDVLAMGAYGLAGGALAARMAAPRFRARFNAAVGVLLLIAAGLILVRA